MKYIDFLDDLKKALNDKEIADIIRAICGNEDISCDYSKHVESFSDKHENDYKLLSNQYEQLRRNYAELEEQNQRLKKECSVNKQKAEAAANLELITLFRDVTSSLTESQVRSLPPEFRLNLYAALHCASKWDFNDIIYKLASTAVSERADDAHQLVSLFRISFFLCKKSNLKDNGLELFSQSVGDRFDSDISAIKGVRNDGIIKNVLLDGIRDIKSNKMIRKSIVEVEN